MNKNIIIVGAIAAGLYILSQVNKAKKVVSKVAIARKKPTYYKPKPKKAAWKKPIYHKPKPKKAAWKKKIIKRLARRKR